MTFPLSRPRPDVARRLSSLMVAQKRGMEAPDYGKVAGRIDRHSLYRAGTGGERMFYTQNSASPTRLRVVVLLDCSGSMNGDKRRNGIQMVRDIIDATRNVPTITTEVWGHTTGYVDYANGDKLAEGVGNCAQGNFVSLVELWRPGTSIDQFHTVLGDLRWAGNEDGWAIQILGEEVTKTLKPNEKALYVVISDGQPIYRTNEQMYTLAHVKSVVDALRRRGAAVVSVAIDGALNEFAQKEMYGRDQYIVFTPDTNALMRSIAKVIGKALT